MSNSTASIAKGIFSPTMTTILVGPDQQNFVVHKALLCERAEYFRSAYRSGLQEARENLFRFDDVDPADFRTLLLWLYTSEISLDPSSDATLQLRRVDKTESGESDSGDSSFRVDSDVDEDMDDAEEERDEDENNEGSDEEEEDDSAWTKEQFLIYEVLRVPKDSASLTIDELDMLIRYFGDREGFHVIKEEHEELVSNWQQLLAEKEADIQEAQPSVISKLIDLYILADRFGIHELRIKAINHLQDQRERRASPRDNTINHLQDVTDREANSRDSRDLDNLPTFDDVTRAFNNLPTTSPLRAWLANVFAYEWIPENDDAEQIAQREQLPKDFWMDVSLINTSRVNGIHDDTALYEHDLCYFHEHRSYNEVRACRITRDKDPDSGVIEAEDFDGEGA